MESTLNKQHLDSLIEVLKAIRGAIDSEVPAQQVQLLLQVAYAGDGGIDMADLVPRLGVSLSSVSRNAAALGKVHRGGRPGHGLLRTEEHPYDRRRRIVYLTPKGNRVVASLLEKVR